MRIQNVWWIGLIVYLVYNGIIYTSWAVGKADYRNMVGSDTVFVNIVLPLTLGAIFVVLSLFYLGWWRPVMVEDQRGRPTWVIWAVMLIMLSFIIVNFATVNWSALAMSHLLLLVAAGVLVGFNEEAVTRGILVVSFRGSTSKEVKVWLFATLLFGLMHLPNVFFGVGLLPASLQVVFAFLAGSGFYLLRRISGTLIIPMVFHGLWDFSTFSLQASGADMSPFTIVFQFGTYLVSIAMVIVVLRAGDRSSSKIQPG
jgi:membrane protease YdiL (CAAX protease family)